MIAAADSFGRSQDNAILPETGNAIPLHELWTHDFDNRRELHQQPSVQRIGGRVGSNIAGVA